MNESCHTQDILARSEKEAVDMVVAREGLRMSHIGMSRVSHTDESCHTGYFSAPRKGGGGCSGVGARRSGASAFACGRGTAGEG